MTDRKYTLTQTGDSTRTLFCPEYEQNMHSDSGAYNEALCMHLRPSGLLDRNQDSLRVLDIGFGLGYNILALLVESNRRHPKRMIEVVSLEKDRSYAPYMKRIVFNDGRDDYYADILRAYEKGRLSVRNFSMEFLFGDARTSVSRLEDDGFIGMFHDPFSPAKNPELWSVDLFRLLLRKMSPGGRLTTYSSAMHIRAALLCAGFSVGRGPSYGRKKEGTVAVNGLMCDGVFSEEYAASLQRAVKATPYRDPELQESREVIVQRRIEEMKRIRACRQAHQE